MSATYDIAIVGYGPVGQTLAILLAKRGWRVGVFEKQPQPYPLPRAVHFDHEVGRILQSVGVADEIVGLTETADSYEWRNAAGETLLRFDSQALGLSGWPDGNMFPQPELEKLLDRRARSWPAIDIRRAAEVIDLEQRSDSVRGQVRLASGEIDTFSTQFLVGCDGSNSFVRTKIGATVTDLGFFFDWLIVDLVPRHAERWRPLNIQICDPARPTTLVSGGPGRRRWEFMRLPGESLEDLNSEATAWRLLAPWGFDRDNARLERHTVYRFQARWVDSWRAGRVLLAGDAAHQMPPFAGQGMCSGLRDAANLAWKLDLVLRQRAAPALLDSYASERVPHVRALIELSMALGRVICIADAEQAAARDAAMTAALANGEPSTPPPPVGIGAGIVSNTPHAGTLFVQRRAQRGSAVGLFDDVIGAGWVLLSPFGDPGEHLDGADVEFLRSIGGVIIGLATGGDATDVDGDYRRWFNENGVAVVLQRPDFYIFGTGSRLQDSAALVRQLRALLSSR